MKIGISTSVIQRGKTGIAQYLFALIRAFEKLPPGHRFVLFALEEDRHFFASLDDRFELVPVSERFRPPIRNILWHQTVLPRLARELNLDVLHVPSYRRLIWSAPCPRVGTIHDLAPFRVAHKYDPARMLYGRVVVKWLARRQDQLIAVSQNTARDLKQFFGMDDVRVVHNGLEHERFYPRDPAEVKQELASRFGLEKPFALYVARLEHPGKNHVRLIEAFEKFKAETGSDWILAFGGSDWHGAEVIHERIRASSARDSIRALGFIPDAALPALYSGAETFLYPSLYEGFGMPPLEAMACGCPVICSDRGSLGEVVAGAARIIDPENSDSIAKALKAVALDSGARAELISRGRRRAEQFSWERTAHETLAAYHAACARAGRRLGEIRGQELAPAALSRE